MAKKKAKKSTEDYDPLEPEQELPVPLPPAPKEPVKSPWKSKTFWTGILVSTLGFLGFVQAVPAVAENPILSNLLLMLVGIVMIALRQTTNQAMQPVFRIPSPGGRQPLPAPLPPYPNPQPPQPRMPDDNSGSSWDGWRDTPSCPTRN